MRHKGGVMHLSKITTQQTPQGWLAKLVTTNGTEVTALGCTAAAAIKTVKKELSKGRA